MPSSLLDRLLGPLGLGRAAPATAPAAAPPALPAAGTVAAHAAAAPRRLRDEVAISESVIYGGAWPKYNPDALVQRRGVRVLKAMMDDEQVKAAVEFRIASIIGRDWGFEIDKQALPSEKERMARIRVFEGLLEQMEGSAQDAFSGVMAGMWQGFSMTEKVLDLMTVDGKAWVGPLRLVPRPFDTFLFHTDPHGNITELVQEMDGTRRPLPINKFIHYVQRPQWDRHYGRSELREIYRPWFSKDVLYRFRNMHLERHGSGITKITQDGTGGLLPGSAEYEDLKSIVTNLSASTGVILPPGVNMEVIFPGDNVPFNDAIDRDDRAIARGLLAPGMLGMSPQERVGGFSQAQTQLRVFFLILNADSRRLTETLNEQLFRPLGELNWPDGIYPRFVWKSWNIEQSIQMAQLWAQLVGADAALATDSDEKFFRDLIGLPDPGKPLAKPAAAATPNPATQPQDDPSQQPPPDPEDPDGGPGADGTGGGPAPMNGQRNAASHTAPAPAGGWQAFTLAMKRVDFAVIDRRSRGLEVEGAGVLAETMAAAVRSLLARVEAEQLTDPANVAKLTGLTFSSNDVTRIKRTIRRTLEQGWDLGQRHARQELDLAREGGPRFTAFASIEEIAAAFFEDKAFTAAGKLTADAVAIIKQAIFNGIKASRPTRDIIEEIYQELARAGVISETTAKEELGDKLETARPDSRLNTIIRTNLFEAMNEARYATFRDPQLASFIEALEYSAILDGVTTDYCRMMDGRTYAASDAVWDEHRPPNHFNCRSLLIAVTVRDTWTPSAPPSFRPAPGFR